MVWRQHQYKLHGTHKLPSLLITLSSRQASWKLFFDSSLDHYLLPLHHGVPVREELLLGVYTPERLLLGVQELLLPQVRELAPPPERVGYPPG
jgi:hypothetical protein